MEPRVVPAQDATTQTIAAISTARGLAAISLIRVSGDLARHIASTLFRAPQSPLNNPRTLIHGRLIDPDTSDTIDRVLAAFFCAPASYTGEDMLEIHTHGGTFVTNRVFQLVTRHGARPAFPGEFTLRAFANAKLDLTQAEAVLNVIHARNDRFLKASQQNLDGHFGKQVQYIREQLINLLSSIEVVFEYPDEDVPVASKTAIKKALENILNQLRNLLQSYRPESVVNIGLKIALLGRSNVGKSSIMNQLAGFDRSIIHESPGTTRDLVGEFIDISGNDIHIMDTAGINTSDDPVEMAGITRTKHYIEHDADEVVVVFDGSENLEKADYELINYVLASVANHKHVIPVINKSDLPLRINREHIAESFGSFIEMSALTGHGMHSLRKHLNTRVELQLDLSPDLMFSNIRQKTLLEKAEKSILSAYEQIELVPQDILTIDMHDAASFLGEITGLNVTDAVLDNIFSNFCVGK